MAKVKKLSFLPLEIQQEIFQLLIHRDKDRIRVKSQIKKEIATLCTTLHTLLSLNKATFAFIMDLVIREDIHGAVRAFSDGWTTIVNTTPHDLRGRSEGYWQIRELKLIQPRAELVAVIRMETWLWRLVGRRLAEFTGPFGDSVMVDGIVHGMEAVSLVSPSPQDLS